MIKPTILDSLTWFCFWYVVKNGMKMYFIYQNLVCKLYPISFFLQVSLLVDTQK